MLRSRFVTSPLAGKRLLVLSEDAELAAVLAGAVAELGGEALRAGTGQEALRALKTSDPQAAVLDLPVADAGAAALLADLVRSGIPAVVVSGVYRGVRASAELRRLGARDLLEKPFPLDALLASITNSLGAAPPEEVDAGDEVTGSVPLQAGAMPADPFLVVDPVALRPRREPEGLAQPLPEAGQVRVTQPDASPPPTGQLAFATVPRLLVALHVGQATGALTLTRGPVKKIVAVERGAPVYAASNVASERMGAICVRRGILGAERLEELHKATPGQRTAELLLAAGLLTPERRAELVMAQIRAVAWSTFEWRAGSYRFQAGRPPAARLPLRLDPGDLILDGMRRATTLERLRAELPAEAHLAPRPDPAFELYALRILPAEAHLLTLADGTKSVADLVRLSDRTERDTLAFLQACRAMRILDEVTRVLASTRRMGFL
jgi:ActR/RegA family two-component response regulator